MRFISLFETQILGKDHSEPIKDTESILVYHAFNDVADAVMACTYGLSGADTPARGRRYSYEANNNPRGLFVGATLDVCKDFGNSIVEFSVRVRDLEAPVWPNGSYTVQGEMSGRFDSDDDREAARMQARQSALKSGNSAIYNSDRPELAYTLLTGGERQALFTGVLTPNSIRRMWVNLTPKKAGKYSTFEPLSVKDFLAKYGHARMVRSGFDNSEKEVEWVGKYRGNPRGDVTAQIASMAKEYKMSVPELEKALSGLSKRQLLDYFWPHQLKDLPNVVIL